MRTAKAAKAEVGRYVPSPESQKMRREIEEYYASIIPSLRRAFAEYVYRQGNKALAPTKDKSGRQESWQAVGRRLYGPEFMKDLAAVIQEKRVVASQ